LTDQENTVPQGLLRGGVRRGLGTKARSIAVMVTCAVGLQTVLILLSRFHPLLELANHLALHGLVVASLSLVVLFFQSPRNRMVLFGLMLSWCYLLFLVQPWSLYMRSPPAVAEDAANSITVLSWNVLAVNSSYTEIDRVIQQADADVVVLIETQPNLLEQLPYLTSNYPISHKVLDWGGSGICLFSKVAGTEIQLEPFGCPRQPALIASIPGKPSRDDQGRTIQLVGLHTLSPIPIRRTKLRDRQLAALRRWAAEQTGPVCVCGDLNTTPWTHSFWQLEQAGFVDSRLGVGNLATWPSFFGYCGIPIDHALTLGACQISERHVLPTAPGSDHRPIRFRLHF